MFIYLFIRYLLINGAKSNALTAENERPIDLVDQNNFSLISLFLNFMTKSSCEINEESNDNK